MTQNSESRDIETLMAEADELIHRINTDFVDDIEDRHRLELETHAQNLKKIKSEMDLQGGDGEEKSSGFVASAEGMHEAIEDIVEAMKDLKKKLF